MSEDFISRIRINEDGSYYDSEDERHELNPDYYDDYEHRQDDRDKMNKNYCNNDKDHDDDDLGYVLERHTTLESPTPSMTEMEPPELEPPTPSMTELEQRVPSLAMLMSIAISDGSCDETN